jgi:uncharacterized protein (TIGR03435 family)
MNLWPAFDSTTGAATLLEVFVKSTVVFGAALGANLLLRRRSADVRRLTLTVSLVAIVAAAAIAPLRPDWTVLPLPRSSAAVATAFEAPAPVIVPLPTTVPTTSIAPSPLNHAIESRVALIPVMWAIGAALILLRFAIGLSHLRRLRLSSFPLTGHQLPRRITLLGSHAIAAPITWGILRPVILVPERFEQLPPESRSHVLRHELAHIQGSDFLFRALAEIVSAALWFQPLAWIVRRQLREEQELASDNRVLTTGGKSSSYAKLLLDWDESLATNHALVAVGMAHESCLGRRLHAILDQSHRRNTVSRAAAIVASTTALAAALPLAAFHTAQAPVPLRLPKPTVPAAAPVQPIAGPALVTIAAADDRPQPPKTTTPPRIDDSKILFEVATVKHGPPRDFSAAVRGGPGSGDPTRYTIENYPMSSLLVVAYNIASYQISGPSWLDEERFTVDAKVPEGATKEQLSLMVRNLIIERFHIATHTEKRDLPGFALTVGKGGPKLTASAGEDVPDPNAPPFKWGSKDQDGYPNLPPGRSYAMSVSYGKARWRFADSSMDRLAHMLAEQIHQPILDATGLPGKYDFTFFWSYTAMRPDAPPDSGPTVYAAVQEQLGLKLESRKIPVDMLVIDHIEKTPPEN